MAIKLTYKHIVLPPFAPLSVKLATQVLSDSVAAVITTMHSLGALPEDAQHTVLSEYCGLFTEELRSRFLYVVLMYVSFLSTGVDTAK